MCVEETSQSCNPLPQLVSSFEEDGRQRKNSDEERAIKRLTFKSLLILSWIPTSVVEIKPPNDFWPDFPSHIGTTVYLNLPAVGPAKHLGQRAKNNRLDVVELHNIRGIPLSENTE